MSGSRIQLAWFYCPLEQKSEPACFKVYYDGGTGHIDYNNPIATISYQGRKFYSHQTDTLAPSRYLVAIRAKDASGIESSSSRLLGIQVDAGSPDGMTILSAEAF